jgi:ubiquinone/menaquinone biosynthesis C-methylase UbiE
VGTDIGGKMLAYARDRAAAQQLTQRVQFRAKDALRMLEFPDASFDLVNQRLASSWLRKWEWTKILSEYQRVTQPGGIIRITDANLIECNSPALTKIRKLMLTAFYRSGRFFKEEGSGLTSEIVPLMTRHGIQDVKSWAFTLMYRGDTEGGEYFRQDMVLAFHVLLPFFQKWTRVPDDYQEIVLQADKEMQDPDFVVEWTFLTAWGRNSDEGRRLLVRGL